MNIYLVSQDENNNYDTYDSFVVIASSEEEARNLNPDERRFDRNEWKSYSFGGWASSPDKVTVELIGTALPSANETKVILASYNAG